MIFCKHCGKQVFVHNKIDMDIYLWRHLKDKHPQEFKKQEDKELEWIFKDNFTVDNPESELLVKIDCAEY